VGLGRRVSVIVAVVAMLLVGGVSAATATTSPKAVFSAHVRAVGTQAQKALLAMPAATAPSSADSAEMAAQLQAIYQRVANRLAALTPPKAIKLDFTTLVASYRASAKHAGAWRDALLHGTSDEAAQASSTLYNGLENYKASLAIVRMRQKGYYFGTFFR
jgi:hypothetical protein